jgi:diguanylate cyclase (GGDEF)-like protein/PAS domain S-box-containing protein
MTEFDNSAGTGSDGGPAPECAHQPTHRPPPVPAGPEPQALQDRRDTSGLRERVLQLEQQLASIVGNQQLPQNSVQDAKSLEHFRALVESNDDAIISKSLTGIVSSWNAGAQAVFGYTASEMVGQPLLRLFPADRMDEETFILEKILEGERVKHFETVRTHKDGHPIHVSVSISPIHDALGRVIGASTIARDITAQRRVEAMAHEFTAIVQHSEDAIVGKTLDGVVTSWNLGAERMFGYSTGEMLGQSILCLIPRDRLNEEAAVLEKIRRGEVADHLETVRIRKDGRAVDVAVTTSPIRDQLGRLVGASKTVRDITAQKLAGQQQRLAASVFTNTSEGIAITDRLGRMVDVNAAFTRITGYEKADVLGHGPQMFRSSRQGPDVFQAMQAALYRDGEWKGEIWSRRKDSESFSAWLTVSKIRGLGGRTNNFVALFSDVTVLKLQQEQLERGAHFDPLTNLPNRLLLSDRLHQAMSQCERSEQSLAVLYMDLDGFKHVNDKFGHEVGDELLVAIAQRMKLALREVDTLARMGGDEFVAVMTDVDSVQDCIVLAQRVLAACSEPIRLQGTDLRVTASIGITMYPQDKAGAEQLMRHADQAMYEAKQSGKNRFHIFDSAQDAEVKSRSVQQDQIAQALAQQEFVLYYQPKVNMRTGAVLGMEALVRWQHPQNGLLAPGAFLPAIEGHPLIERLGLWVLNAALQQMHDWATQGLTLSVSVNIAARQLQQDSFARQLAELLAHYPGVQAQCLELEVLETSALDDIAATAAIMQECHRLGVQFAIDDFGTGYSSLTYLRHLPVETLKIDQSFVRDMLDDQDDLSIVTGVIGLALAFHRAVIAEGVETVAHGRRLIELGCDKAQGYGIARPMPAAQVAPWCTRWTPPLEWTQAPWAQS